MKVGDLVKLVGSMYSSYEREGELGLLLEIDIHSQPWEYQSADFSRVLWHDGVNKIYKNDHLRVINETNLSR